MFTELYREEKREEGDRGDQEDKRGGVKRRETDSASNHFLMCTPQLDISEMFAELYREEKK